MTLGEILRWNAKRHPDKEAIVSGEQRITFKDLLKRVNSIANGFLRMGIKAGDRVAFMAQNCHQHIELLFAAAKAGVILVPIAFRSSADELLYIINDTEPDVFIMSQDYQDLVKAIHPGMKKGFDNYICLDKKVNSMISYEEWLESSPDSEPDTLVSEDCDLTILYTSGSTGKPKGVVQTQRSWVSGAINQVCSLTIKGTDIALITVPLYHLAGIWPFLSHLFIGGSVAILRGFDPIEVLEAVEKERVSTINLVPTHLIDLLRVAKAEQYDLSSLRMITYGAAPMPVEVLKECIKTFGNIFTHVYGLTETTGVVTCLKIEGNASKDNTKKINRYSGSCGREGIFMETRVINSEGNNIQPGEIGEIIVHGPCVMKRYWKNHEETSKTLERGWLHTGDLATVNEDGYIFIKERKGFKIISGGENIYPKEVEDVIYQHPAVKEVAVVGVPDKRWGEAVKAVIVLKEGSKASADEIIEFCKKHMTSYKKPKSVDFVSELPKSSVGKISKREIKQWYW